MNGVIGGMSGKNYESNDIDVRAEIVKYTANTHKFLQSENTEIDYFIFSWEPNLKSLYTDLYQPKAIVANPQIKFNMPDHFSEYPDNARIQAHYSRWYGAQQVLQMMLEYKAQTGIEYDLVVNARLDLCFHRVIDFNAFDKERFHLARPINLPSYNWPKSNEMIDHIFIASESNMQKFLNLYDNLNEYTKPGQCPRWKLISNHFLTVWHLNKINLLDTNTISESLTVKDEGCDMTTDYHIFRYENLTVNQLIQYNNELYRNSTMG
jgi:hypothetical protein